MTSIPTRIAAATLAAAGLVAVGATAAQAAAPDTACQRAGMNFLKENGLFTTVAKNGITVGTAVSVGVTVRPGADVTGITADTVIPFSTLLADHRAGANSTFVYPWCE